MVDTIAGIFSHCTTTNKSCFAKMIPFVRATALVLLISLRNFLLDFLHRNPQSQWISIQWPAGVNTSCIRKAPESSSSSSYTFLKWM